MLDTDSDYLQRPINPTVRLIDSIYRCTLEEYSPQHVQRNIYKQTH